MPPPNDFVNVVVQGMDFDEAPPDPVAHTSAPNHGKDCSKGEMSTSTSTTPPNGISMQAVQMSSGITI